MRSLSGLMVLAALAATPVSSQILKRDGGEFNEALRPSAEIAGGIVVGLQMHAKEREDMAFRAMLPKRLLGVGDVVCVRIISANGLYDAANRYSLTSEVSVDGTLEVVPDESNHSEFTKTLDGAEIAASITKGECDAEPTRFVLASWDETRSATATIFVNSQRADTVVLRVGPTEETVRCEPVEVAVRSAYDTLCTIVLDGLTGEVPVSIFRFTNRTPSKPTEITLLMPGG